MRIRLKAVEFDPLTERKVEVPAEWDRWIVQFSRALTRDDIDRMRREYGLALGHYVPDNAYLEHIEASRAANLRHDPLVRSVTPYLPRFKLDPEVTRRRERNPSGTVEVVAEGYSDVPPQTLLDVVHSAGYAGAELLRAPPGAAPRIRVAVTSSSDLGALARVAEVKFIEPSPRIDMDADDQLTCLKR